MLVFDIASDEGILDLHRHRARHATLTGDGGGFARNPRRHVREGVVPNLAGAHEVAQGLHDLFDGRDVVPDVHPEHIDVVRLAFATAGGARPLFGAPRRLWSGSLRSKVPDPLRKSFVGWKARTPRRAGM